MKYEQIMKKLEEIKVDAYNNLSSGEEESELQVESATEEHNCEPAGGEEVKVKTPKPENVKAPKTLSRATSMDGGKGADKSVYLTDATLKATQQKLDELKNVLKNVGDWPGPQDMPQEGMDDETKAKLLIEEAKANPSQFNPVSVKMLEHELSQNPINPDRLKDALGMFTQG